MNQTRYHGAMPPEGVLCQLEQRKMRKKDACYPGECLTCGWNSDKWEDEGENDKTTQVK